MERFTATGTVKMSQTMRHIFFLGMFCLSLVMLTGCETRLEKYRNEGVKLYNQKQYDESMVNLDKALHEDQFDATSNAYAGLIHYLEGEYQQAEYHSRLALN